MPGPHDIYFKKNFRDKKIAREFLEQFLDEAIISKLDLFSLELEDTSYIDDAMQEYFADIIYTCFLRDETKVKVCLILEHKSYIDPIIHLQLLRYMVNGWEKQRDTENSKKLTPILPVVVYHGKSKWVRRPFKSNFELKGEDLNDFIPEFQYLFSNLSSWSDEGIYQLQAGLIRNVVLALKHSRNKSGLIRNIEKILTLGHEQEGMEQPSYFVRITLLYLYTVTEQNMDIIKEAIEQLPFPIKKESLTLAEQLILKGEVRGMEKGIEKKQREMALKAKELGFQIADVASLTGLSEDEIRAIWQVNL